MTLTQPLPFAPASDEESILARKFSQALTGFVNGDKTLNIALTRSTGERMEATVPAFAIQVLARALSDFAMGKSAGFIPSETELTTHQAAEMLHVSRPYLIKLLDERKIPHRKVGSHRRIRYDDLRAYLDRENAARRETLRELAAYDQEIGLYDLEDK